jgi:hypothetical protein
MQRRFNWSVLIYSLIVWGVTSGLSLYGMSRDPWIGEQGSGEHPLILLGMPLWFGLIGATAVGVPLPIAALLGAALQFVSCLPLGLLTRWLVTMTNLRARGRHRSMRSQCIIVTVTLLSYAPARAEQSTSPIEFRTRRAPAVIHILEAPRLVQILGLDKQQQAIQTIVDRWKVDYLKKAADIALLPADDVRRRRWAPERDHEVGTSIEAILTTAQQKTLTNMIFLWTFSPVVYSNALRDEYVRPLSLTPEQQEALFDLNVQWVVYAIEDVDDEQPRDRTPHAMLRRYESIAGPAWRFKDIRDVAWRRILTDTQAEQWKQIELRQAFRSDLLIVLQLNSRACVMEMIGKGQLPLRLVPYFDPPGVGLMWTEKQEQQIRKIAADVDAEVAHIQTMPDTADRRTAWARLGRHIMQSREYVVALMTESQRAAWRKMIGNDFEYHTHWPNTSDLKQSAIRDTRWNE